MRSKDDIRSSRDQKWEGSELPLDEGPRMYKDKKCPFLVDFDDLAKALYNSNFPKSFLP